MKPTKKETATPAAPVETPVAEEVSETVSEAVEPTEGAEVADEQETVVEAAGDDEQETVALFTEPTEGAESVFKLGTVLVDLVSEPLADVLNRLGDEVLNKVGRLASRPAPFQYLPLLGTDGRHAPAVFDSDGGLVFGASNIAAAIGAGNADISVLTVPVLDVPYVQSIIANAVNCIPRQSEDDDLIYRVMSASPA